MKYQKKLFRILTILSASALGLTSCTPSFKTTEEICATFDPVTLARAETIDNNEFKVLARRTANNYKLYLEDAFNSLNGIQSKDSNGDTSALTADEQAAIQFIFAEANEKMGYVIEDGEVVSANNPIDYIESLFAASDENEVIQTFVDAKQNLANAISKADRSCNYSNSAINLIIEDDDKNILKTVNTQVSLNYNPNNKDDNKDDVDQIFLISLYDEPITDLTIAQRKAKSFSGFSRIASEEFKASGISTPKLRQVNLSDNITNETFFFDDDFSTLKLGQLVITQFDATCKDIDSGEEITCTDPNTTRQPKHDSCDGGVDSATGQAQTDENNKYKENYFTAVEGNANLEKIRRLRLEVEYPKNEIRLYASKYAEAILTADVVDPDAPTEEEIIYNPTRCEKQAVLDDLLAQYTEEEQQAPDFEGVRLIPLEDPNYDLIEILDADGEPVLDNGNKTYTEPTPIFTFHSTQIPAERQ